MRDQLVNGYGMNSNISNLHSEKVMGAPAPRAPVVPTPLILVPHCQLEDMFPW